MTAATIVAGLALALELGVTPEVAGQARAADHVTAARAQLGAAPAHGPAHARRPRSARAGTPARYRLQLHSGVSRARPAAAAAPRGVRDGHRPERSCEPHHGWDRARAIRGG